jgi:hypothetical protein
MAYSPEMQEAIEYRARELYQSGGRVPGHDLENWCQAEAEIVRQFSLRPVSRAAVVVNVDGVLYTAEYESALKGNYAAGEWKAGDPVPVRISDKKLFLRRRNGQYLETIIMKRDGRDL